MTAKPFALRRLVGTTSALNVAWSCLLAPLASGATVESYGELTGKTILAPSALPSLPDSIDSELPADKANAIAFLEKEFSKKGISVVQDGPSFARLVPSAEWQAGLSNAPLRGLELRASSSQQLIPAGAVNFPGTELSQVLAVYAELKNCSILRARFLPSPPIRFKNQCPLTREELVYALETVLALNGISTVDDGPSFVQIVPIQLRSQARTHAPRGDAETKLFDPNKVPSMGQSDSQPQTKVVRDLERWRKAFFEFMRLNEMRSSSAQRLLELYAGLADKTAEPSAKYEHSPIWFHVTRPLSKSELLYAIETTFALNNLGIRQAEDGKIQLIPSVGSGNATGGGSGTQPPL